VGLETPLGPMAKNGRLQHLDLQQTGTHTPNLCMKHDATRINIMELDVIDVASRFKGVCI